MLLRKQLEHQGHKLFRWRSYLPLLMVFLIGYALWDKAQAGEANTWSETWGLVCFVIALAGQLIRSYTTGCVPEGTSGRNTKEQRATSLNTTGVYSLSRHPLYLGNLIVWIGIVLLFQSFWLTTIAILIFWVYYERIMYTEEAFLESRFGDEYVQWGDRTSTFLPRFRDWKPTDRPFSWKRTIRKEYSGFFTIVSVFSGIVLIRDSIGAGALTVDPLWLLIFVVGAVFYLTVLILKKATRVLDINT